MPSAIDQLAEMRAELREDCREVHLEERDGYDAPATIRRAREIGAEVGDLARAKYLLGLKKHSDQPPLRTQGVRKILTEALMESLDLCIYLLEALDALDDEQSKGEPFTVDDEVQP